MRWKTFAITRGPMRNTEILYSRGRKGRPPPGFGSRTVPWLRPAAKCAKTVEPAGAAGTSTARRTKQEDAEPFRNDPADGRLFKEHVMPDSVYKVVELVGTSSESWEKAAATALNQAAKSIRDLRVAEVVSLDVALQDGKIESYRATLKVSFKYETD